MSVSELFCNDSIDKQLNIVSEDGDINISNTELNSEKFELTESLCSETELVFGSCEASVIKFTVSNTFLPMKNKMLTVSMTLDGHVNEPYQIGKYRVYSDKPTADRKYRDVVAYDPMYELLKVDATNWYANVFPTREVKKDDGKTEIVYDPVTLRYFRDNFFKWLDIEIEQVSLVNDDMLIEKTIDVQLFGENATYITGKDILNSVLEANGCFGHFGRDGKFHFIYLEQSIQGLYPRNDLYPADDLYPRDPKSTRIGKSFYIHAEYEDYLVKSIDGLQIREKENDIGVIVGGTSNPYIIEDNFLFYGKGTEELTGIANNILSKIRGIVYRPFTADCKGNPCLEVGDAIRIPTKYEIIESYILKRTLKGIQALRDSLEADGEETRTGNVNGIHNSIIQLKGKSNVLERTIEETRSTITNVEAGLKTEISQTAENIRATVAKTGDVWDTSEDTVTITSYGAPDTVLNSSKEKVYPASKYKGKYYLDQENGYLYLSDGATWKKVKELKKVSQILQSSINVTAGAIEMEVKRATEQEGKLSSSITATEQSIALKVSANEVISAINMSKEGVSIQGDKINLIGTVTANDNVKILKDGSIYAKNAYVEGEIQATSGKFKGTVYATDGKFTGAIVSSSAKITGGSIQIESAEAENYITLNREGVRTTLGNDGAKSTANNQEAIFQYSQITTYATDGSGNPTTQAALYPNGVVFSQTSSSSSDRRLKDDIRYLDPEKSKKFVNSLKPCSFIFKATPDRKHRHGFIAQEVMDTLGDDDWGLVESNRMVDGQEFYGIAYTEIIPDLVAVVQSQQQDIEHLKEKVGQYV